MVVNFKALRPVPQYPTYPPYHTGPYLEEYFYNFYLKNKEKFDKKNRTLIPVFWTNLYLNGVSSESIQQFINVLPNKKYFTVCQFDDGIQQTLPEDTINFVAGGNKPGIPIPLICSPIPHTYKKQIDKDIFCSFVGTVINNDKYTCRIKLYQNFSTDTDFYFNQPRMWTNTVTTTQLEEFTTTTQRSIFTLCPRDYGLQSFRLYEAMQLGSIPVFVYNKPFFPFEKFIDWDSFCVRVHEDDIPNLKTKLKQITKEQQIDMIKNGRDIYNSYFTLEGMCNNILKSL